MFQQSHITYLLRSPMGHQMPNHQNPVNRPHCIQWARIVSELGRGYGHQQDSGNIQACLKVMSWMYSKKGLWIHIYLPEYYYSGWTHLHITDMTCNILIYTPAMPVNITSSSKMHWQLVCQWFIRPGLRLKALQIWKYQVGRHLAYVTYWWDISWAIWRK